MSQATRGPRIGLKREVAIVLPIVLLLLVVLSTYTLLSYRAGLKLMIEERHSDVSRLAGRLAQSVADGHINTGSELRERAPNADYFALVSPAGDAVFEGGSIPSGQPLVSLEELATEGPIGVGPRAGSERVIGLAPTFKNGSRHTIRVDQRAPALANQKRSLDTLTWVVLPINAALSILVLLFLRHLMAPYDRLLATARRLGDSQDDSEDEVAFLISSFEKAVRTIEADRSSDEDLATLELALGPSLESGFLLLGRDGEVLSLNPVGAALLGVESAEPPKSVAALLEPHPALAAMISTALETLEPKQRQEVEISRDGHQVTLGLSVHPLRRDDGAVRGHLVLFADLTETRRQAEEQRLSESLAQVGELAAGVAHEMRNSLSTFRGYLTLVERAPDEESITDYLSELRRETDHLQRVLEDFLSFARPESSRPELLDLATLVRRAAVDPALAGNRVVIEGRERLPVQGDPQLLERALRNLLHNACQAQEAAGASEPVSVRTVRDTQLAVVEILDRGAGVPEAVRARLFEPFVTSRPGGVGLGLSLARRIVDLHGGRLELEDRPGGGTTARLAIGLAGSLAGDSLD